MGQEINAYFVPISSEKKILVVQRFNGIWEFPGGGVEFGEHPEQAARRELEEETSLRPLNSSLIGVTSAVFEKNGERKHAIYIVYAGGVEGTIKLTSEHRAYKWVSLDELFSMRLGYNAAPVPAMLKRFLNQSAP